MEVSFKNNNLIFKNNIIKSFNYTIKEIVVFKRVIVVRLNIPPKEKFNENIFGINFNGQIKWQIEKMDNIYDDSPYISIKKINKNVKLSNWDSTQLIVEPETGKIIR